MKKTIFDFYTLFGIQVGAHYHAYDYACQVCKKAFDMYEESPKKEKPIYWEMAQVVARSLNPPRPIRVEEEIITKIYPNGY